jgi:hypothetical protein
MSDEDTTVEVSFSEGFVEGYLTGLMLGYQSDLPGDGTEEVSE